MIPINPERLMSDLRTLAVFGKLGTGVDRTAFSKADIEARQWLAERMERGGLKARIDGVGNVIGRGPGPAPAVLIGSHTDSVPRGGWLDGAMGVIYGLEAARALGECEETRHLALDVASCVYEEGAYFG